MNILVRLVYLLFGEPSVSKAVKNIDQAIAKLEKAVDHQTVKAANAAHAAIQAQKASETAISERDRAERVRSKMADLLS